MAAAKDKQSPQGKKAGKQPQPTEHRQFLQKAHQEIEQAQGVDKKGQELLLGNKADIRALMDLPENQTPNPHPSMLQRLQESIDHLEATHPDLTRTLTELLNVLSNAGI